MILEHFLLENNETNCYILASGNSGAGIVIDPGEWTEQMTEFMHQQHIEPRWILLTHGHGDHTDGIETLKSAFRDSDVKIGAHSGSKYADQVLSDGDIVELGDLKIKVLETPGHTPDSLSFMIGCDVFCGDLLFAGSVGGTSSPEEFQQEIRSIREKLFTLGDDIVVHPGHGPATTVQIERIFNPFLMP